MTLMVTSTKPAYSALIYSFFGVELAHPGLLNLDWDEDRTDVHGVTAATYTNVHPVTSEMLPSPVTGLSCNCGVTTGLHDTVEEAFAELVEHVPSTVVATVPAQRGMSGYRVHALREGAPLPGGHRITHVEDYGSDTHLNIVSSDGRERCIHRHTQIRVLDSGVVQVVTPDYAGWAAD
ncbi:hypothetical protein ACIBQ1_09675 [Nonomuraea sp. NPDC050153]|uniref:hypothetical protein n=1 Tax=Nonomuraea sp. NPDC050153 TaxID=3364359 RepID=UPI00379C0EC1